MFMAKMQSLLSSKPDAKLAKAENVRPHANHVDAASQCGAVRKATASIRKL